MLEPEELDGDGDAGALPLPLPFERVRWVGRRGEVDMVQRIGKERNVRVMISLSTLIQRSAQSDRPTLGGVYCVAASEFR